MTIGNPAASPSDGSAATLRAAFMHSPEIEKYRYPTSCPFKTERAYLTKSMLMSMGLYTGDGRAEYAPAAASEDETLLFHTRDYLDMLKRLSQGGEIAAADLFMGIGTPETPVFNGLLEYALLASGATIAGARLILNNQAEIAFNPSGGYHHALSGKAGGFCYINDIVLGCKVLAMAGKRVFCLDLDVHHGNGTQEAFYRDPSVFTVSFHESGTTLYPWGGFEDEIGEGAGAGFNVNMPFPPGTDDDAYVAAFKQIVPPLLDAFAPDVIVAEIGMDVLAGDPLAHLRLTNNAFADILPLLLQFQKPMLVTGGGGYNPQNTARGWALTWTVLCGLQSDIEEPIGMGGVFLGSSEWRSGLRDMRVYAHRNDYDHIHAAIEASIAKIKNLVFPLHGI